MKTICDEPLAVARLLKADQERAKQRFARRHRGYRAYVVLLPYAAVLLALGLFWLALQLFSLLR
jgi:hypothetical protein